MKPTPNPPMAPPTAPPTSPLVAFGARPDDIEFGCGGVVAVEGPKGKLQYGLAYGYLSRTGWVGVGGTPHATNNLVYTSFRYYLP